MDYRVYVLDNAGRIRRVMPLHCSDDTEALLLAVERVVEIWQQRRFVARLPPLRNTAAGRKTA